MAEQVVADKLKLSDAPKKLQSKVWQYFGFRDGIPPDNTTCKLCFTAVAYPKSDSTTNLMQHRLLYRGKISVNGREGQRVSYAGEEKRHEDREWTTNDGT
ncbi:hypothetical protein DPMN_051512 [Dreissena polymorpha]|uniref:BED-type domain-containing protein n=1 Tax=Dreissena polymorpha TaxID=45954 RepID=A0A9D4CJK8_DREPO|nr:hypothetical protein DPMN_051512 [Dreissena polymorpha]